MGVPEVVYKQISTVSHRVLRIATQSILLAALICTNALAGRPVIPGAVGFGMDTPAGRGGKIMRVTNLNDSGEGSLRACVEASGPRYCVFEVSGAIRLQSELEVKNPNLTLAGQTAPAPGILIRGATLLIKASDVLIQHVAIRVGDDPDGPPPGARDSVKILGSGTRNVVLDHCSIGWAVDENISAYENLGDVTISNSIVAEPLHDSIHPEGAHGLIALIDTDSRNSQVSFIGNLLAHGHGRNPWSSAAGFAFVNNVVYNARDAEMMLTNRGGITSRSSIVGNVFIKGRDSYDSIKPVRLVGPGGDGSALLPGTQIYLADNSSSFSSSDPWSIVQNKSTLSRKELEAPHYLSWPNGLEALHTDGGSVLDGVLRNAGTRPGERNSVDARIIADVRNGTGGIINCVSDNGSSRCAKNAGGWPDVEQNVRSLQIPGDPHGDGDGDGYTNMEEWLHQMAARVEGTSAYSQPEDGPPPPKAPELH